MTRYHHVDRRRNVLTGIAGKHRISSSQDNSRGRRNMRATDIAAKPWQKACTHCKKPTFEDLLDEQGLCDYCREIVAIKVSSKKNGSRSKNQNMP